MKMFIPLAASVTSTAAISPGLTLHGTEHNDTLIGGDGNDSLYGRGGNDVLEGRAGNDIIWATLGSGDGLTRINAGAGADEVTLLVGASTTAGLVATGGAGADTYILRPDTSGIAADLAIRIVDFRTGTGGDRLDLGWLLPFDYGRNPFDDGMVRLQRDGADTLLQWHDAGAQAWRILLRLENVLPTQLGTANFAGGIDPNGGTSGLIVTGTAGMDELRGGFLDDTITGLDADDILWGLNGNDALDGGAGDDRLFGGAGDDVSMGGAGNDLLYELDDQDGDNRLYGGAGDDTLRSGSTGVNLLDGGAGNDLLEGGNGNDTLLGGAGNDTLDTSGVRNAVPRDVVLSGGDGDDQLILQVGDEAVRVGATGGAGADVFHIRGTNAGLRIEDFNEVEGDLLDLRYLSPIGLEGNPLGAIGYLRLVQAGADTQLWYDYDGAAGTYHTAMLAATLVGVTLASMTRAAIAGGLDPQGSNVGRTIEGTRFADILAGTLLDDTIRGLDGGDVLQGDRGQDRLEGGNGADTLWGATGNDTLLGGADDDYLDGGDGNDLLDGGDGNDILHGREGDDHLIGGDGDDLLRDDDGNNILEGGAGNDTIHADIHPMQRGVRTTVDGGDGNDWIGASLGIAAVAGGKGDDHIVVTRPVFNFLDLAGAQPMEIDAGDGNDKLYLDGGMQTLRQVLATGGAGRDVYQFSQMPFLPLLTITDFAAGIGGDMIDVDTLLLVATEPGNPFGQAGRLQLVQRGADTVLQHDVDGAASADLGWIDRVVLQNTALSSLRPENFGGIDPMGSTTGAERTGTDGDDVLTGFRFDDLLRGGNGGDQLNGERGDDLLYGDAGNDVMTGGEGNDRLFGGAGNDWLYDGGGVDEANLLDGGDGDDRLSTDDDGGNILQGGAGSDSLWTTGSGNLLDGGDGDDELVVRIGPGVGTVSVTTVHGGAGDDRIELTLERDTGVVADGGAGRDTYVLAGTQRGLLTILDFQTGEGGDLLDLQGFVPSLPHQQPNPFGPHTGLRVIQRDADTVVQKLVWANGSSGYQAILVLANVDTSTLGAANVTWGFNPDGSTRGREIDGSADAETLGGGWLDDVIRGGGGDDILIGQPGDDYLIGGDGNDTLNGDLTLGLPIGIFSANTGHDTLEGGAGNDLLISVWGNDVLRGGDGDDVLRLESDGINIVHEGSVLQMHGDAGDDRFEVRGSPLQPMKVTLSGGAGRDTYALSWQPTLGAITILDFAAGAGGDLLEVGTLAQWAGDPFADGRLRLIQQGSDTLVQIDRDGPRGAAGFTTALKLAGVDATTLGAENIVEGYRPLVVSTAPPVPPAPTPTPGPSVPAPPNPTTPPPVTPPVQPPVVAPVDLTGTTGVDRLLGGASNDRLDGGSGNDVLVGGAGNDILIGGSGTDSAHFSGARGDYTITHGANGIQVVDRRGTAGDGSDILTGVERLHFAGGALAFDLDGAAGQAYRIYRAAFDRAPDLGGIGFWMAHMDAGARLDDIAAGFAGSPEFADLYGSAPSNEDIVLRMYRNILDRDPDQGGYTFWLDVLDSGRAGVNTVLAQFSESVENRDAVAELIANGIAFTPYGG